MIIVTGYLIVDADQRTAYLRGCEAAVAQAREADGNLDFALSPDLLDAERINVQERWETRDALASFRGSGPSDDQAEQIRFADVHEFEVA